VKRLGVPGEISTPNFGIELKNFIAVAELFSVQMCWFRKCQWGRCQDRNFREPLPEENVHAPPSVLARWALVWSLPFRRCDSLPQLCNEISEAVFSLWSRVMCLSASELRVQMTCTVSGAVRPVVKPCFQTCAVSPRCLARRGGPSSVAKVADSRITPHVLWAHPPAGLDGSHVPAIYLDHLIRGKLLDC
jgi:hypothetical protein